jgi:hypothetical protein
MWKTPGRYIIKLSTGVKKLWTTRRSPAQVIHILALCLTMPVRLLRAGSAPKGDSAGKLRNLGLALCLFLGCLSLQKVPANADINAIDAYKIYAHIKIGNYKEFVCLEKLWTKESNWRPKAKNKHSSAYGIPQLLKMKETNPYKQIDLGLKYIAQHRVYKGDVCKAFAHHRKHGWY